MKRIGIIVLILIALPVGVDARNLALNELRFRVAEKLGQDTTQTSLSWSNAAMNAAINDGVAFVSHAALCKTVDTSFALSARQFTVTMPGNYIKTESIIIAAKMNTPDLDWSPLALSSTFPAELGKTSTVKVKPEQWYDRGEGVRQIILTPSPMVPCSVRVTYFAYGKHLSSGSDSCDIPQAFQRVVPHYAAAELWSKTRTQNPFWAEFIERLSVLLPSFRKEGAAEPPSTQP